MARESLGPGIGVIRAYRIRKGKGMNKEEKIIDLILTMIEQSNDRMKRINQKDEDGYGPDIGYIKLEQKEFEMQIKLLERVVKDFKSGKGFIDITPASLRGEKEC